jgi:hypothetical protein
MKTQRLIIAGIAAVVLAVSAVDATADRLSFSNRFFRITWNSFTMVHEEEFEVECVVTVEGSFHSATIAKRRFLLIGHITRAIVGRCGGAGRIYALNGTEVLLGRAVANSLPWPVFYDSFLGRLPKPSGMIVMIEDAAFLVEIFGFNCLYRSNGEAPWYGQFAINGETRVVGIANLEGHEIPRQEGEPLFCPPEMAPTGTGGVQLLGQVTSIFIRLI